MVGGHAPPLAKSPASSHPRKMAPSLSLSLSVSLSPSSLSTWAWIIVIVAYRQDPVIIIIYLDTLSSARITNCIAGPDCTTRKRNR
jgi:hypothetical protein